MAKFSKKIGSLKDFGHSYDKKYFYYVKNGFIYYSPRAVGGKVDDKDKPNKTTPMDERREMNGTKTKKVGRPRKKNTKLK